MQFFGEVENDFCVLFRLLPIVMEVVNAVVGDRYVSGDPRFQTYCKSNPRKMVKMWAEKEMRNLARLYAAGIRCPKPIQLRMHVLVMDFIGLDGVAALRLKVTHQSALMNLHFDCLLYT